MLAELVDQTVQRDTRDAQGRLQALMLQTRRYRLGDQDFQLDTEVDLLERGTALAEVRELRK